MNPKTRIKLNLAQGRLRDDVEFTWSSLGTVNAGSALGEASTSTRCGCKTASKDVMVD